MNEHRLGIAVMGSDILLYNEKQDVEQSTNYRTSNKGR